MMMVMMVMVVMVVVIVVVMMMVMVILSHYDRLFFRDTGVGRAFVLGSQNVLSIRNRVQQLGK